MYAVNDAGQETIAAWSLPEEQRSPRQRESAAFADAIIAQVEAADVVVIAAPMYNFTISSTLKAWIDHLARAGRTFRYTAAGPEGLLKGKKVFVVTGRGGVYSGESPARGLDFQKRLLVKVQSLPEIESASLSNTILLSLDVSHTSVLAYGKPVPKPGDELNVIYLLRWTGLFSHSTNQAARRPGIRSERYSYVAKGCGHK